MADNKKTVAILGSTGMLGSMAYNILKDKRRLVLIYRDEHKLKILNQAYDGVNNLIPENFLKYV